MMECGDEIVLAKYTYTKYKDQYGIEHAGYRESDVVKCIVMIMKPLSSGYQASAQGEDGQVYRTYYERMSISDEPIWFCDDTLAGSWRLGNRKKFGVLPVIREKSL